MKKRKVTVAIFEGDVLGVYAMNEKKAKKMFFKNEDRFEKEELEDVEFEETEMYY